MIFREARYLRDHVKDQHEGKKPIECEACGKKLKSKFNL